MKQITIRGIPAKIGKMIKREAEKKGFSLNKVVISLLEKASRMKEIRRKKSLYHDLDHLFGVWSKEDAEEFAEKLD